MNHNVRTMLLLAVAMIAGFLMGQTQQSVHAQSRRALYIEPGTTVIRPLDGAGQVRGKVVVDTETGDIWGFPTSTSAPYPVDQTSTEPPVAKSIYLGRYDFASMSPRR